MAEVWYAENKIGNSAAVKILLPELCRNNNIVERFLTEAKTMVALNHPNIRKVYDYGDIDGCPAIVMEYLDGDDLKTRMKHGERFTDEELVKWWNQLVDAMKYTHSKGIVHRDIKPGNIFADKEGNIRLLDFGMSKSLDEDSDAMLTMQRTGLGTPGYMSPEQYLEAKDVDFRSDLFSVGATMYYTLTGEKPFKSETFVDAYQETVNNTPPPKSELTPYCSEECAELITHLMEKNPLERPNSYEEVLERIQALMKRLE